MNSTKTEGYCAYLVWTLISCWTLDETHVLVYYNHPDKQMSWSEITKKYYNFNIDEAAQDESKIIYQTVIVFVKQLAVVP